MAKAAPEAPALFGDDELLPAPAPLVQQAYDLWNEYAKKNRWNVAKVLDAGRRTALRRAVKDYGGLVGFRANLDKISRSEFCMGRVAPRDGHKQFQASLDWFIRPVTVRKVIEDFYNGGETTSGPTSISKASDPDDTWARWLRDYKPKSFWPSHLGPRPGEPGCRAPRAMVEATLKRLGITVQERVVETEAQRLSASIVTHRRLGNYERANQIEEKLAKLENRPPVMVPAPEVAHLGMPEKEPPANPVKSRQNPSHVPRQSQITDVEPQDYDAVPEGDQYEDA